jgi:hypothetical protein
VTPPAGKAVLNQGVGGDAEVEGGCAGLGSGPIQDNNSNW